MEKVVAEILFRTPEGEETTDERLEALYDLGFDDAYISSPGPGLLAVRLRLRESTWEDVAQERAESVLDEMGDLEVIDIYLDE